MLSYENSETRLSLLCTQILENLVLKIIRESVNFVKKEIISQEYLKDFGIFGLNLIVDLISYFKFVKRYPRFKYTTVLIYFIKQNFRLKNVMQNLLKNFVGFKIRYNRTLFCSVFFQ